MANEPLGSSLNGNGTQRGDFPGLPFRDVLLQHVQLSRQVSQALFASIQSSFSTALPPDPIPRPERLSEELVRLPIWSLPAGTSPTSKELIPSLVTIHDSLDELLLKARTHRENVRRIQALKEDTDRLQSIRRERIRKLRDANVELREAVLGCNEEMSRVKRARREPLNYADVLSYASDLARNTSAPPGWSGSNRLLQQQVSEALKTDGTPGAQDDTEDKPASAKDGPPSESKDTPMTAKSNAGESTAGPDTPAGGNTAPTPAKDTPAAEDQQQQQKSAPFTNPEESGPSATSAPHSLPFPSDADMRRGLLGVAMLEELEAGQPAEFKSVMPSWRQWIAGQEGAADGPPAEQKEQEVKPAAVAVPSRTAAASAVKQEAQPEEDDDAGFGLDLN